MRRLKRDSMGIRQRNIQLKSGAARQIDSKDREKIGKRGTIDDAQTKELIDARNRVLVFKLREPRVRNVVFLVAGSLREPSAELFNFPGRDAKAISKFSQLISGTGSTGHCVVSVRDSNAAQPRTIRQVNQPIRRLCMGWSKMRGRSSDRRSC